MNLRSLHWHDGRLDGLRMSSYREAPVSLWLDVSLYADFLNAKRRDRLRIKCSGVSRLDCTCDFLELIGNRWAGNINGGSYEAKTLRLDLFGGQLSVCASRFIVEDR